MDFEPSFLPINLSRSRLSAQSEPSMTRDQTHQELNQLHTLERNIQEAIQNAQHVQESLIPPTSITNLQMPPLFYPTTTSTQIPPFRSSLPPSSTFAPLDESLWIENPHRPQVHTCPHCQRTETIVNNFQDEIRSQVVIVWWLGRGGGAWCGVGVDGDGGDDRGDRVEEVAGWCDGWWWGPAIEVALDLVVGDGVEGDGVIDWLQVEDTNSTFFHRSVKTRMRRSRIDCVMDHDNVLHEGTEVPIIFVDHYMQFLGVESPITPLNHEGLFIRKLSQIPARIMIRDVNDDEIRTAMFSIGNDRRWGGGGSWVVRRLVVGSDDRGGVGSGG
ncbi:hypothetical protein Tco_1360843 [Tanacetum coccineum]